MSSLNGINKNSKFHENYQTHAYAHTHYIDLWLKFVVEFFRCMAHNEMITQSIFWILLFILIFRFIYFLVFFLCFQSICFQVIGRHISGTTKHVPNDAKFLVFFSCCFLVFKKTKWEEVLCKCKYLPLGKNKNEKKIFQLFYWWWWEWMEKSVACLSIERTFTHFDSRKYMSEKRRKKYRM